MKFLFIHIPKCGGTSIVNSLGRGNVRRIGHVTANMIWHTDGYTSLKAYERKVPHPHPHYLPNYLDLVSFSVIRNPLDKIVSTYFFRKEQYKIHRNDELSNTTFKSWFWDTFSDKTLKELLSLNGESDLNKWSKDFDWMFILPQYYWVSFKGKIVIDNILKLENINEDFENFCKDNQSYAYRGLRHLNKSKRPKDHYLKHYDSDMLQIMKNVYKKDFETFHYDI